MSVKNQTGQSKKKEDGQFDLEQQFILRMPPGPAMALRRDVESGANNLKDKLSIELQPDHRHGQVRYGGQMYSAKLMDLPAIVETLKTTDRKTFYKTADISQVLVCSIEDEVSPDESEMKKKDKDKKYQWNQGLTLPLKNVRKRRFRKTMRKKHTDQTDTEKEVKRLFRQDSEAQSFRWEMITEEEKTDITEQTADMADALSPAADILEMAEHEIFGDVSSSEDEEEKEVNIMDSGGEDSRLDSIVAGDLSDSMVAETSQSVDTETSRLHAQLQATSQELDVIRESRQQLETAVAAAETDDSEEKLLDLQVELQMVLSQESSKEKEFDILSAMLNQN